MNTAALIAELRTYYQVVPKEKHEGTSLVVVETLQAIKELQLARRNCITVRQVIAGGLRGLRRPVVLSHHVQYCIGETL